MKKRVLLLVACLLAAVMLAGGIVLALPAASPARTAHTVVLDAGHGGVDRGASGRLTQARESEINLDITLRAAALLEKQGVRVVLTRKDENGLYGDAKEGLKMRDMNARKAIIEDTRPDLVVSVHCNTYPMRDRRGAQVFYNSFSADGKRLATALQSALNTLNKETASKSYSALAADYFMLNCSQYPSAIAECGFLTNAEDEALLTTADHREALAYQIFSGIIAYLRTDANYT